MSQPLRTSALHALRRDQRPASQEETELLVVECLASRDRIHALRIVLHDLAAMLARPHLYSNDPDELAAKLARRVARGLEENPEVAP